ncbi:MAG: hypothetical protein JO025_17215 [Verrucomicrobia bacterium]|nr:hypothetical protein [Verrucomicrobiota bacterium]
MVAISGAVCGSRLLHHFGQRHDFWRDYAWGIAMVKSGSPPGWVDPGQRELIPIVPLALRPNPS